MMQRKKGRGYYSESVELGTHILPVAKMRKFTMSNVLKYLVLLVIAYIIYSVYQKASKSNMEPEYWSHDINDRDRHTYKILEDENDVNIMRMKESEHNVEQRQDMDRRVKQEINRVFEEFRKKQEDKMNLDKNENGDVFQEYHDRIGKENANENERFNKDRRDKNDFRDVDDETIKENEDQMLNDNEAAVDMDNINIEMFEVDEDEQKEKEELEIEKEIEERLAEAFKEAIHEAEQEVAEKKLEKDNVEIPSDRDDVENDKVNLDDIPNVQPMIQKKEEFKFAVNNLGKRLNPEQIHNMNEKARRNALTRDDDHEFPPFVTAVRETNVKEVTQLVASVQEYFPGRKIYIYDLDLNKDTKRQLMSYCGVKMRFFFKEMFPNYVKNLNNLNWKPLIMQTALAEFGHMIWVNPKFRLTTQELAPLIHESHERGVLVIGQMAAYTTYAATHPDMLKFIPADVEKLSREPHLEIRAVLIHNTDAVHQNIMKMFTACALEESCLSPEGAKWTCRFDFTGRKPAGCHRYDESALNILLKNWFNFDTSRYARQNTYLKPCDSSYKPKLKSCRDPRGIKDKEL